MYDAPEPRMVLHLVEILELIFLETDARTLLTSIQLVCYRWYDVIRGSPRLQAALFLRPYLKNQPSSKNPFTKQIIDKLTSLTVEPGLLRPEASWRRMLPQQPPVSLIKIRHAHSDAYDDVVQVTPVEELRMQHLADAMNLYSAKVLCGTWMFSSAFFFPDQGKPVITLNDGSLLDVEEKCDMVVYDPDYNPRQVLLFNGEPLSVMDMLFKMMDGCHLTIRRDPQWLY
ncbi:hypothetical protein BDV26DRAFT_292960 [Aspergillus bertholletiae]|uniref:F-box domain-containing protein n=1 Tax=Aspergillus bertholletiae TaxID=1226010 RepID=A0A5N7B7K4_9EURO|nr:hypothetical protein BDV26DRAFT_292960 [Aspergillus bertholletiae]